MVLLGVVIVGFVALGTDAVFLGAQLLAVGLVAIATDHSGGMHFALYERAINVDFVQNLTVVIVKR